MELFAYGSKTRDGWYSVLQRTQTMVEIKSTVLTCIVSDWLLDYVCFCTEAYVMY